MEAVQDRIEFVDLSESVTARPSGKLVYHSEGGGFIELDDGGSTDLTVSDPFATHVVIAKNVRCFGTGSSLWHGLASTFRRHFLEAGMNEAERLFDRSEGGTGEHFLSRLSLFVSDSLATDRDAEDLRANTALQLFAQLGRPGPERATAAELSALAEAEKQAQDLYEQLRDRLAAAAEHSQPNEIEQLLAELNKTLAEEARVLEPVLRRRLPSVERTETISERADALLRKHGEDPPT